MTYNDLTCFDACKSQFKRGDLVFFDGSDNSDLIEIAEHVLPNGIEFFTHSNWSHVGMLEDENTIIESTIDSDGNGPQLNDFRNRVRYYDGCNITVVSLDPIRASLDINAGLEWGKSRIGIDKYSITTIRHYIMRAVGLAHIFPHLRNSIPGQEVCSEFITMILQRMGIEKIIGKINFPNECSPETLWKWPIGGNKIQLIRH